jgi:hypothetical protein
MRIMPLYEGKIRTSRAENAIVACRGTRGVWKSAGVLTVFRPFEVKMASVNSRHASHEILCTVRLTM